MPVIRLDELTDEQRKAYMLVHNKLTMNTDFDIDVLNMELDDITLDMSEFGFEDTFELEDEIDVDVRDDYFDFVFTSPPYFNTEMYADEDSQSYKRADDYNAWKTAWYYPMIDKIVKCMKKGAYCVLNVGNARYPMEKDAVSYLNKKYNIRVENVMKNKIGGAGIGARAGEDGEPFIAFRK